MKQVLIALSIIILLISSCSSVQEQSLTFGAVLPLSGPNAFYGEFSKYGIELAVEDINKAGGINGQQLKVIFEDAGDKAKAASAAQKLLTIDGVRALLTITTPMAAVLGPIAEEHAIPLVYASAADSPTKDKRFVFKDYPDAVDICDMLVAQIQKDGHKDFAMFAVEGEQTQLCEQGMKQVQMPSVIEKYTLGQSDFRTQFTKIKQSSATALILWAFSTDCEKAYAQLRELGVTKQIYVPAQQFTCGSPEATAAGEDLLEDAYGADVAINEASTNPAFVAFKQRLQEKGWTTQVVGSAMMYDSTLELAQAYNDCKDSACAADKLRQLVYEGVSGHIAYGGDQIVEREIMLTHFEDGKWVEVS